ncbi:hypothetical protein FGB62_25g252 [Gracilaria domingensis]|nr:hypothetical protein FGB62_25g252 [Gracilaria domingensis]
MSSACIGFTAMETDVDGEALNASDMKIVVKASDLRTVIMRTNPQHAISSKTRIAGKELRTRSIFYDAITVLSRKQDGCSRRLVRPTDPGSAVIDRKESHERHGNGRKQGLSCSRKQGNDSYLTFHSG